MHVEQPQHRAEQVVVAGRLAAARAGRGVEPARAAKPGDSHITIGTCLLLGRDRIRQAVQVEVVLAERLAVVGDVDQRRVVRAVVAPAGSAIVRARKWSV